MAQVLTEGRCEEECLHPDSVAPILGRLLTRPQADAAAGWFATLADPSRTRILQALALAPELCVCDLALAMDMSVSALSHQLAYLRERGVVARRKEGRVAFYSLADEHVRHVLTDALAHIAEASPKDSPERIPAA